MAIFDPYRIDTPQRITKHFSQLLTLATPIAVPNLLHIRPREDSEWRVKYNQNFTIYFICFFVCLFVCLLVYLFIYYGSRCCHSNATRALIANPPNSAQLGAAPTTTPSYIWVRAVVSACGRGQTDKQTRMTTIHFASSTTHAKCNKIVRVTVLLLIYIYHQFVPAIKKTLRQLII